jgi:DNA invertase Pin-like site-specific DNA recombinase
MNKLIGYARVSTKDQNTERQEIDLKAAGVRADDLYVDHGISGAKAERPGLTAALKALQTGDTLVITTLDRLGRSTVNLLSVIDGLKDRGVHVKILGLDIDTRTTAGRMVLTMMSALAEMERNLIRERSADGMRKARDRGVIGGRKKTFTDSQIKNAKHLIDAGKPATDVARDLGMSRATLYRRINAL